jgi:hypothetical protein
MYNYLTSWYNTASDTISSKKGDTAKNDVKMNEHSLGSDMGISTP